PSARMCTPSSRASSRRRSSSTDRSSVLVIRTVLSRSNDQNRRQYSSYPAGYGGDVPGGARGGPGRPCRPLRLRPLQAVRGSAVSDTTDLREGAPLHDALLALLPLVGRWAGTGAGVKPSNGEGFAFRQQLAFSHDGRPFLAYDARAWLIDADGHDI